MLYLAIGSITFAAGVIRGLTGFGGPLILVPVLSFFYEPGSAVATVMLVDLTSNASLLRDAAREANWRIIGVIAGGAILTLPLGGYVMVHADTRFIRSAVYATVAFVSILLLTGWRYRGTYSTPRLLGAGAINGVIVGATSFGAALYPFLLGGADSSRVGRANFVLWALFCSLGAFGVVLLGGKVGTGELVRATFFIPIYALGAYAGNRWFHHVNDAVLKRVVLVTLIGVSIGGLVFV